MRLGLRRGFVITSGFPSADFPTDPPRAFPSTSSRWYAFGITSRHHQHTKSGTGMLTCCPSSTPFGLDLGSDLPWEELPCPGTLRFTAAELLTLLIATHVRIITSTSSSSPYGLPSTYVERSPTRTGGHCLRQSAASVVCFSPDHFRRKIARLVSYYALFK